MVYQRGRPQGAESVWNPRSGQPSGVSGEFELHGVSCILVHILPSNLGPIVLDGVSLWSQIGVEANEALGGGCCFVVAASHGS